MSGLKEKKEKRSLLRDPLQHLVKGFRGKNKSKPTEDPQQPPKEQKSPLLRGPGSDGHPMQNMNLTRHHSSSAHSAEVVLAPKNPIEAPHVMIKMSNGKKVDAQNTFSPQLSSEMSTSPNATLWSPSTPSSYQPVQPLPFPNQGERQGYTVFPSNPSPWTGGYDVQDTRGPIRTAQEVATYDNLLKEAQTLRGDLEKEYNLNRGSKEDVMQKINLKKIEIADAQKNKPTAEMYDEIIVSLSQELIDLERKVREIEARMRPLDRAIVDLKDVEDFISDRELDSDGALMVFEDIMKKMFEDINVSQHALTGEATSVGHLPRNVLDEMKGKMQTGALKKTDPGKMGSDELPDWVNFGNDYDTIQKMTTTSGYEANIRKKRKDKFQRVSRKMSSITEFTHSRTKNPARTEAFKFHAFDRADAFRNVDYMPRDEVYGKGFAVVPVAYSVTSEKSVTEDLLPMGTDSWMGFNQSGMTPPPSTQGSMRSAKSVADLQDVDQYPGIPGDSNEAESLKKGSRQGYQLQPVGSSEYTPGRPRIQSVGSGESLGRSPPISKNPSIPSEVQLVPATQAVPSLPPEEQLTSQERLTRRVESLKGQMPTEKKTDGESQSMAQEMAKMQLKKPTDKPKPSSSAPVTMDADLAVLAASVMSEAAATGKANVGVKLDLQIKEPPETEKKPATKPPPPPPKKAAPPPPPPPKRKGPPPPPPGKKAGGKAGGPPPPPGGRRKAGDGLQRAPEVIAMFQEMRKALLGNAAKASGGPKKIGGGAAADPAALMEELAKNSKYAAQVQADVENYGPVIEDLIKEVSGFEAEHMKDLIEFVKRVDSLLAELSDETAVLKQFEWPARYYTMLEAKGLYEELEKMKKAFKPWKKTAKNASEELKNIQKFMDKSKNRVDVILRTKDGDEKKFKENRIPWNSKIYTEVKIASLSALVVYMEIVLGEVDNVMSAAPGDASPQRSKAIEKSMGHLTGAINFAFKAHQFAGGFTESCNAKFAEIAAKTRELKSEVAGSAS